MRIPCLVSDTVRDATAQQRHILPRALEAQGHEVHWSRFATCPPDVKLKTCSTFNVLRLWLFLRRWQPEVIHVWNPPGVLLGQLVNWAASGYRLVITATTPPQEKRHWLYPTAGRWI